MVKQQKGLLPPVPLLFPASFKARQQSYRSEIGGGLFFAGLAEYKRNSTRQSRTHGGDVSAKLSQGVGEDQDADYCMKI